MARNYAQEYANYQGTEEQKKNRAKRNAARREAERKGLVRKGDGMDIDHKKALSKGGSNAPSNLQAVPKSQNRSYARNPDGSIKRK